MKEIKDYLHLYLGCECMIGDMNWKRQEIHPIDLAPYTDLDYGRPIKSKIGLHVLQVFAHKTTPILRHLSSMTEEEKNECGNLDYDFSDDPYLNKWSHEDFSTLITANQFIWLLSKHFDLFGLIEAGLAFDKTTLK